MMHRRSLLSWLGASAASTFNPLSAITDSQPSEGKRIVALESFLIANENQMARFHAYLSGVLFPFVNEIHRGPGISLEAIVAPHVPQALLLRAFSSFDEMLEIRSRIVSDPRVQQARADLESAHVLSEVRSQVLIANQESLRFPADSVRLQRGVFEVCSFHAPAWHDGPPARVGALLSRAGIHPILNASTAAGEHVPRFTYLIPFESLVTREEAWTKLNADPKWIEIQGESIAKCGSAVKVTGKSIYKLAPSSQLA